MRRDALLCLLLLGACASLDKERDGLFEPKSASTQAATGMCKPFFVSPFRNWDTAAPRHSCWNRIWEIPTAIVVTPIALAAMTAPIWAPIVFLH